MERRGPQEVHLDVVWRQVIAGGQPGLVELHGSIGGGEQPVAKSDFHMSGGWDDVDRVAWRHDATGYRWVPVPSTPTTGELGHLFADGDQLTR